MFRISPLTALRRPSGRGLGLWLVLAPLGVATVHSQTDSSRIVISGSLVNPDKGPVGGAEIVVVGEVRGVFSGEDGRFQLPVRGI